MMTVLAERVANQAIRFGIRPRELKRFIKFAFVGVIGAVVDFGFFNLLRPLFLAFTPAEADFSFALPLIGTFSLEASTIAVSTASGISFICAIISNFMWNRFWTYPDSRTKSFRRQFAQFFVVSIVGILIRVPIVAATHGLFEQVVRWSLPRLSPEVGELLGDNLAVAFAVGIVMFWNFFINRYWTYNDVE